MVVRQINKQAPKTHLESLMEGVSVKGCGEASQVRKHCVEVGDGMRLGWDWGEFQAESAMYIKT